MRSRESIESDISQVQMQIDNADRFLLIAEMDRSDVLLKVYEETCDYYRNALQHLDDTSPTFQRDYVKFRICLDLITGFIASMKDTPQRLKELNENLLKLQDEHKNCIKILQRREKNRM